MAVDLDPLSLLTRSCVAVPPPRRHTCGTSAFCFLRAAPSTDRADGDVVGCRRMRAGSRRCGALGDRKTVSGVAELLALGSGRFGLYADTDPRLAKIYAAPRPVRATAAESLAIASSLGWGSPWRSSVRPPTRSPRPGALDVDFQLQVLNQALVVHRLPPGMPLPPVDLERTPTVRCASFCGSRAAPECASSSIDSTPRSGRSTGSRASRTSTRLDRQPLPTRSPRSQRSSRFRPTT